MILVRLVRRDSNQLILVQARTGTAVRRDSNLSNEILATSTRLDQLDLVLGQRSS